MRDSSSGTGVPTRVEDLSLEPQAIELANAYGPYAHGTWAGRNVAISNENALAGRGAYMASLIRRSVLEHSAWTRSAG